MKTHDSLPTGTLKGRLAHIEGEKGDHEARINQLESLVVSLKDVLKKARSLPDAKKPLADKYLQRLFDSIN